MTISELQNELQVMYEKHGDIEVVVEDTSLTGNGIYYYNTFKVKEVNDYNNTIVVLSNS